MKEWILCTDQLPRGSEIVLVTLPEYVDFEGDVHNRGVTFAHYVDSCSGGRWFRSDGVTFGELGLCPVTPIAWMHAPKPYKEQCNNCCYYDGVHGVQGVAPCAFDKEHLKMVVWNNTCDNFLVF